MPHAAQEGEEDIAGPSWRAVRFGVRVLEGVRGVPGPRGAIMRRHGNHAAASVVIAITIVIVCLIKHHDDCRLTQVSLLPLFVGMEVILTESVLPPKYVRGTPGKLAGAEVRAMEPPVEGRASRPPGCV